MFLRKILELRTSLIFRLTFIYAAAFTLLSSCGYLIFYSKIYQLTMDDIDSELSAEAAEISYIYKKEGPEAVISVLADRLDKEESEEDFYLLFTREGEPLFSSDLGFWSTLENLKVPLEKGATANKIETFPVSEIHDNARVLTAQLDENTYLQIGESLEEIGDYLDTFLQLFSLLTLCQILVSAIVGWYLAKRATVDMNAVTRTANEIISGDFSRRVSVKGELQEITLLANTFNAMLDRIQRLLKAMREINDNIAHDLRSPLTRIRGLAEMNLLHDKGMEGCREMAANTVEECDNLISMINTMFDITEAEAGIHPIQKQEFELVSLIRRACELFHPVAETKNIELATDLPPFLPWKSDQNRMQRIITNLLENAIKYTNEGGRVSVSAKAEDDRLQIEFEDNGIGIAESDLPLIFQRFFRCARSRSQKGVGLGLSLTKAYTESLQGTINVESQVDQGSRFILRFGN